MDKFGSVWKWLSFVLFVLLLVSIFTYGFKKFGGEKATSGLVVQDSQKVKLEFYVMSQCPYGVQVEDAIKPVIDRLGGIAQLQINYIAQDNGDGTFQSLHGPSEVEGDMIQLCAIKNYPEKAIDFIACQNKNQKDLKGSVESCARESGMDPTKINTCVANEGKQLLSESIQKSNAAKASASPTIIINNEPYNGNRGTDDFSQAICQAVDYKPAACATVPKPVKVDVMVLNDETCKDCETGQLMQAIKNLFSGASFKQIDINTDEGKDLIQKYGIEKIPTYIFNSKVTETTTWTTNTKIQTAFVKVGDSYRLIDEATGATRFVSEEKQKAYEKQLADEAEQAKKSLGLVSGDNKPQIDFFVMSYCPYGNQAEELVAQVYKNLGDKAIFNPRYVIYNQGTDCYTDGNQQYCSMHGGQELHQDVRELCVNKYMKIGKYFDFILEMNKKCTSQNADSCWEGVAKDLKLDVNKIKACEKDEALSLVKREYQLNQLLKVSGSPAIFVEGETYNGPRTAAGYQNALCVGFEQKPSECSTVIATTETEAPTGGCG